MSSKADGQQWRNGRGKPVDPPKVIPAVHVWRIPGGGRVELTENDLKLLRTFRISTE